MNSKSVRLQYDSSEGQLNNICCFLAGKMCAYVCTMQKLHNRVHAEKNACVYIYIYTYIY